MKLHHNRNTPTLPQSRRKGRDTHANLMLATTIHESNTTPHHQAGQQHANHRQRGERTPPTPHRGQEATGLLSQDPTVCLAVIFDRRSPTPSSCLSCAPEPDPLQVAVHPSNRRREARDAPGVKSRRRPAGKGSPANVPFKLRRFADRLW